MMFIIFEFDGFLKNKSQKIFFHLFLETFYEPLRVRPIAFSSCTKRKHQKTEFFMRGDLFLNLIIFGVWIPYASTRLCTVTRTIALEVAYSQDVTTSLACEERRNAERLRLGVPVLDRMALTCEFLEGELKEKWFSLWTWRVFRPRVL